MSEALDGPHLTHGVGWTALIYPAHIEVRVSQHRDPLPDAIGTLLSLHQRRYWMCEYVETDNLDRDVYLLTRGLRAVT